jgi:hypothetical protein
MVFVSLKSMNDQKISISKNFKLLLTRRYLIMDNKVGVKFTYYRMGTTISRMTDIEDMQEVINHGLENIASNCIEEVLDTTGLDLNKLSHPYPATRFCFFSELTLNPDDETINESKRVTVFNNRNLINT